MKARLALAFAVLALALALLPSLATKAAPTPQQCAAFCARARCAGDRICGLYVNSAGQTVCGCHDR